MIKNHFHKGNLSFRDKFFSLDFFLIFLILLLGIISFFAMYSTEQGKFDYYTKSELVVLDPSTGKMNVIGKPAHYASAQFSPDGSFVIYQAWRKGKMEILFSNLLDQNNINLTRNSKSHDIISHGNAFSPDGLSIVFTSERDGNKNIYLMN